MSSQELVALLSGREIGRILRDARGRLRFVYDESWRRAKDGYPLSLSMPLTASEHSHAKIEAFLWGLLPDNDRVIERWARDFHVGRNAFSLLMHVGEDCAGAVQFARREVVEERQQAKRGAVEWLTEEDVGKRLRALRDDQTAWRRRDDAGQFSLAGAQSKTALLFQNGRWGVPSGRIPTTHILKPPMAALRGHVENEHFCLELARQIGLPAPYSYVQRFGTELAIVIERYDRLRYRRDVLRLHQEDACQALGIMPTVKYESQGGPGARAIVELLREVSSAPTDDVWTFVAALGFSWLTGGTDAHAKNYSLLLADSGRVRLAPFYDLSSILLYPEFHSPKLKLAMKIGTTYLLEQIGLRHWLKMARDLRLDADELVRRLRTVADLLPDAVVEVVGGARSAGLSASILDRLAAGISARARACRRALD